MTVIKQVKKRVIFLVTLFQLFAQGVEVLQGQKSENAASETGQKRILITGGCGFKHGFILVENRYFNMTNSI